MKEAPAEAPQPGAISVESAASGFRGEDRHFYKGLICLAVALHHHGNGNERGRMLLLRRALDSMDAVRYKETWVNYDELREWARRAFAEPEMMDREAPHVDYTPP